MTQSDDRRDLPPEQDAVRRLLAEARHDEPVPPAVAARLDAVLAELTAERRETRTTAPVVDLAARRRRGAGVGLLAAAAVVVAGVGIGQVIDRSGSMDGDNGSATSSESFDRGDAGGSGEGDAGADAGAGQDEAPAAEDSRRGATASDGAPEVSTDSLRRDLRAALLSAASLTAAPEPEAEAACAVAEAVLGDGTRVPITLDGRPALAVYAVPQGGRQQVDVYLCSTAGPAERVWLPVR